MKSQRQLIYDVLCMMPKHPTAQDVFLEVRKQQPHIAMGTVYRNLGVLSEAGAVAHVKTPAADRYDARLDRHHHLLCIRCGRVFDAPLRYCAEYDALAAGETGFHIFGHRTLFEGVCPACAAAQAQSTDLEV